MAKPYKPRTIKGVSDRLARNVFVSSKVLRKAIDRDQRVKQLATIPGQYAEKYEELRKATSEMVKEHGAGSRKIVPGTRLQVRSAQNIFSGGGNFRQTKRFLEQIMPEMKKSHELGHKNISVLRGNMSLALESMDKDDPRRPQMRALFEAAKELDKLVDKNDIDKVDLNYLLNKVYEASSRERDISVDYKADIDILKGISGVLEIEYEPIGLNQEKGKISAFLGELFKDLIQEDGKRIEKFFETIDITGLKGSPTLEEDILNAVTEAIDPKKKKKKRKRGSSAKKSIAKVASTKVAKKKLKRVRSSNIKKGVSSSPLRLIGVINKELPNTVRKNMQEPGLQSRTGRFAESVKLTDVVQTPQGFPSFGYTYQKNPYQVFEMGRGQAPWASPERDPRKVIDRSIREIAAQFAIGRFYTRRE